MFVKGTTKQGDPSPAPVEAEAEIEIEAAAVAAAIPEGASVLCSVRRLKQDDVITCSSPSLSSSSSSLPLSLPLSSPFSSSKSSPAASELEEAEDVLLELPFVFSFFLFDSNEPVFLFLRAFFSAARPISQTAMVPSLVEVIRVMPSVERESEATGEERRSTHTHSFVMWAEGEKAGENERRSESGWAFFAPAGITSSIPFVLQLLSSRTRAYTPPSAHPTYARFLKTPSTTKQTGSAGSTYVYKTSKVRVRSTRNVRSFDREKTN